MYDKEFWNRYQIMECFQGVCDSTKNRFHKYVTIKSSDSFGRPEFPDKLSEYEGLRKNTLQHGVA